MKLKKGVRILGVKPELAFVMPLINEIVRCYDLKEGMVITSVTDGKHGRGSKHYSGYGIDIRTRNMKPLRQKACTQELKANLGSDFDVVLEKDHIHLEYDPKH